MRAERKRIFISDLPETATQVELENAFKNYGKVISTEIKERKELGPKNSSLFFAYVNVEIDDRSLQQCFNDFAKEKWYGQYVMLQVARESFLERIKREREESGVPNNINKNSVELPSKSLTNGTNTLALKKSKYVSSGEEDSSDNEPKKTLVINSRKVAGKIEIEKSDNTESSNSEDKEKQYEETNQNLDLLIIKNNKGKVYDRSGLKIASVGNKPIITIDKSKKKVEINTSESNLKRLQSLNNLKKDYKTQKSLIQAALSKVDTKPKNKIIFDELKTGKQQTLHQVEKKSFKSLFNDDHSEDDGEFEANFNVKEQFLGKDGQKLLELQSKYKSDKRFALDARFLDDNERHFKSTIQNDMEPEEISLEEEKRKEYEILEQVLGKKITPKSMLQNESESTTQKKSMLRFDPSQPGHSKYELKIEVGKEKKKRKRKESEVDALSEKKQEEKDAPEVSKEVFYKVTEDLKETLHEKQEFSLLSMFGKATEKDDDNEQEESCKDISKNKFINEKNPFRYDSSDDEDETKGIPNTEELQTKKSSETAQIQPKINRNSFWSEPFFFKEDDYRLQEGFDFMEKMKIEEKTEFTKLRRDLKEIVKAKVRNNQRKLKPFKKKLGGNKRKKMIKMKKALKR